MKHLNLVRRAPRRAHSVTTILLDAIGIVYEMYRAVKRKTFEKTMALFSG